MTKKNQYFYSGLKIVVNVKIERQQINFYLNASVQSLKVERDRSNRYKNVIFLNIQTSGNLETYEITRVNEQRC